MLILVKAIQMRTSLKTRVSQFDDKIEDAVNVSADEYAETCEKSNERVDTPGPEKFGQAQQLQELSIKNITKMFDSMERGVVEVKNSNHINYTKVIEAVNSCKKKLSKVFSHDYIATRINLTICVKVQSLYKNYKMMWMP